MRLVAGHKALRYNIGCYAVDVAQWAEHRTVDAVVEGSSPFIHPDQQTNG
jgi:hypothetical protein